MNQSSGATGAGVYLATLFRAEDADSLIEIRCPKEPKLRRFFPVTEIEAGASYIAQCATYVAAASISVTGKNRRSLGCFGQRISISESGCAAWNSVAR